MNRKLVFKIGFYVIYHYDLDLALDQSLRCFDNE
jgi:hypothetical protein